MHLYNEILSSHRKNALLIHRQHTGTWKHDTKWNKPDLKKKKHATYKSISRKYSEYTNS